MNPEDEVNITILANAVSPLEVFAKSEGVKVKRIEQRDWSTWGSAAATLVGGLASLLTLLLKGVQDKVVTNLKAVISKTEKNE